MFWRHSQQSVEDVVADTCAAVALTLNGARGGDTFAGYTYGHFLNARRRLLRSGLPSGQPLGNIDVAAPLDDDDGPELEDLGRLRQALDLLPHRERKAIVLRYFEERNSAGIGTELGVTSGNARRILFNGLQHLRAQLGSRSDWLIYTGARE